MSYELYNQNLINVTDLKKLCPEIPDSVDDSLLTSFILREQESYLELLLGCSLYQEILFQKSGNTLSIQNAYIFNRFIADIIAFSVMIKAQDVLTVQIERSGAGRIKTNDESTVADLPRIKRIIEIYEGYRDNKVKSLIQYVNDNINDFPLFHNSTYCNCDDKMGVYENSINMSGF